MMNEHRHDEHQDLLAFLPDPADGTGSVVSEAPLEPTIAALVHTATRIDGDVPREMMWARIRQARMRQSPRLATDAPATGEVAASATAATHGRTTGATPLRFTLSRTTVSRVLAVAATLTIGVAIGRYAVPDTTERAREIVSSGAGTGRGVPAAGAIAANPLPAMTSAQASAPAVVAMEEHLARTVMLLTSVRDDGTDATQGADVGTWARELLNTTRLLLDEPQLRDARTRRLLQDLELVLVQIIQARGTSAPEALRAPSETMRETNLLPRVRAAVTASLSVEESTFLGVAE